jgi:hypothetical protein
MLIPLFVFFMMSMVMRMRGLPRYGIDPCLLLSL